jgi:hypothetical protein
MRNLKASAIYFGLVFAVGWVLGPIRQLRVVPHLDRVAGLLLEYGLRTRVGIGSSRLAYCSPQSLWVRGVSVQDYLADLATAPGLISLLSFLLFAAVPGAGWEN